MSKASAPARKARTAASPEHNARASPHVESIGNDQTPKAKLFAEQVRQNIAGESGRFARVRLKCGYSSGDRS